MEDFVLPDKWCIKVTDENKRTLEDWRYSGAIIHGSREYCASFFNGLKGYWLPTKPYNYPEITFEQFKQYVLKQKTMERELKITPPEGYEIDMEKSTLEHIIFKPVDKKAKTWEEIQELHNKNEKPQYYLSSRGDINIFNLGKHVDIDTIKSHVNTKRQAEKIRALCQLYIIADYYNDGWEVDWDNQDEGKHVPCWDNITNKIDWNIWVRTSQATPPFKSKELLLKAYESNKEIFETALKP